MIKKLMLSVLSLATLLTLTSNVYALGSTDTNGTAKPGEGQTLPEDVTLEFNSKFENLGSNETVVLNQISELNSSKPLSETIKIEGVDLSSLQLLTVVQDLNLMKNGQPVSTDDVGLDSVVVTWEVPNLTTNMVADVLHYNTVKEAWEILPATVNYANKTVTCEFPNLSPVAVVFKSKAETKPSTSKPSTGYDDGGPFTTDACGNVFDRWGNEVYHSPVCVNNSVDGNSDYNFVNTSDR